MTVDLAALAAPTPANEIKQRKGPGGKTLDYVDARWVMERLDSACGPDNWQDRYEEHVNGSVRCGIAILIGPEWITKWDVGDPSDIEPTKGAHSDAFKRAAVKWGIGRDLYGDHARPQNGPRAPQTARTPSPAPQSASVTMQAAPRPTAVPDIDDAGWEGLIGQERNGGAVTVAAAPPRCSVHDREMKSNKRGFYCSAKNPDGSWCEAVA